MNDQSMFNTAKISLSKTFDEDLCYEHGGVGNVEPITEQIVKVEFNTNFFMMGLLTDEFEKNVTVEAEVCGFTNVIHKTPKPIKSVCTVNMKYSSYGEMYFVFSDIIITESSHFHGKRLFMRFHLNYQGKRVGKFIDTTPFVTVSRRWIDKCNKRNKRYYNVVKKAKYVKRYPGIVTTTPLTSTELETLKTLSEMILKIPIYNCK